MARPPSPLIDETAERGGDAAGRDSNTPRHSRRLSDKVLIAFHHACDQGDFEIAEQLLHVLENIVKRPMPAPDMNRRRSMDSLVAAHERLWFLRHPHNDG